MLKKRQVLILLTLALTPIAIDSKATKRGVSSSLTNYGIDVVGGALGSYADSHINAEADGEGFGCAYKGGCHKGYCWTGCQATAFNNEWCYTTRGYSQDYNYIRCSSDSECDRCWKCAGSCTV